LELLRDKPLRNFRVDIAADSLVMLDENQNKQDRMQFLQAFGGFLAQALPVGQASPQMVPMMMELLRFGMQAFKAARPIEGQIDATLQQLAQAAQQQPPDQQGKQAELQQKGQVEQSKMQMESALAQAKMQQEMQLEQVRAQAKMAMEQQKQQFEAQIKAMELQAQQAAAKYKADLDAQTRLLVAQMNQPSPFNQ